MTTRKYPWHNTAAQWNLEAPQRHAASPFNVWVVFPTCNADRCSKFVPYWRGMGYKVAIQIENVLDLPSFACDHGHIQPTYDGYWRAVNRLAVTVVEQYKANVVVCAADDMLPDPKHTADDIAQRYLKHFPDGYGILQPTGDTLKGTDCICGSPWMGRGWVLNAYEGCGPYHAGYGHFFADEELLHVARAQGCLVQDSELTQQHHHWSNDRSPYFGAKTEYQTRNSSRWWDADKAIYERRKADGFPGSARSWRGL